MNACDQIPQEIGRASCRLNERLSALQSKILKLQYSSKSPAEYLVMQELMEDYKEYLERYIEELEALNLNYSERLGNLRKGE